MKKILLIIIICTFISCAKKEPVIHITTKKLKLEQKEFKPILSKNYNLEIINNCEYIIFKEDNCFFMEHYGFCINCIEEMYDTY